MVTRRDFLRIGAAGAASLALGEIACGDGKRKAGPGGEIHVGAKSFQEQLILSALLDELIEKRTAATAKQTILGGTNLCHKAILAGDIDCYVEYTGTAYTAILKHYPISDADAVYARVKADYEKKFNLLWLPPLGFENTYAILVRKTDAEKHNLRSISDLTRVVDSFRPGFGFEFFDRADGYRGLIKTYQLNFSKPPKQMELGLIYRAISAGEVDVIAGNSTDGQIAHLGLVMLTDDKHYFPPYDAAPVIRAEVAAAHPAAVEAIRSIAGTISADRIRAANYAVDSEHQAPKQVAAKLLAEISP
ncbi:MAG TPA: glycine betaine ABC transporter substrate-binding protein [Kofleriaceae bacterium]|nr:glycine betaine ABC transporter substrate-binding protein [Kofleriaceae bacterium]